MPSFTEERGRGNKGQAAVGPAVRPGPGRGRGCPGALSADSPATGFHLQTLHSPGIREIRQGVRQPCPRARVGMRNQQERAVLGGSPGPFIAARRKRPHSFPGLHSAAGLSQRTGMQLFLLRVCEAAPAPPPAQRGARGPGASACFQ